MKNTKLNSKIGALAIAGATFASVLMMATPTLAADMLTRQLQLGMSGSDVSILQAFLAKDVTIYPQGLVTGYFGSLTASAVSRFQARNGVASVGRVGPITLALINAQLGGNLGFAPSINNVSVVKNSTNATVSWTTDESAKGVVYYSASPLVAYERVNSVDVSGAAAMTDTNLRTSQSVSLTGLNANTTYYYMIYVTDADGNVSVTAPGAFFTTTN